MIIEVYCLDRFCPRRLHGAAQRIGRVRATDAPIAVELYCGKCRVSRWYTIAVDGRVTMGDGVATAPPLVVASVT